MSRSKPRFKVGDVVVYDNYRRKTLRLSQIDGTPLVIMQIRWDNRERMWEYMCIQTWTDRSIHVFHFYESDIDHRKVFTGRVLPEVE